MICRADFMGADEVRWEKDGAEPVADYTCSTDKVKSRLSSGNVSYLSVQNLLTLRLLCKNITVKTYRSVSLSVVSVVCCQIEVFATGRSLVQRSPAECLCLICCD
jgi:hypothetical protein